LGKIPEKARKYTVKFKPKDQRPNKIDDKFELFRHAIGLEDTKDFLEMERFQGHHKTTAIRKELTTVVDINSYYTPFINARLTEEQVIRLRKDPNVEYVAIDGIAFTAAQTVGWDITKVKAPTAWASPLSTTGTGAIVAVMDTGCDSNHIDLKGNVKVNQSFLDGNSKTISEDSPNYHGTHVMGSVCALNNTEGVVGVAPTASTWNLRGGGPNGLFNFVDVVEAFEYAKQNKAQVINVSIASSADHQPTADSIKDGYDRLGIIFVGAEGNEGLLTSVNYISKYYGVIGVSNIQSDNNLHPTSNHGPNTDFCAPGASINSTKNGNAYQVLTGTSMAAPHVSGLCALALSAYKATSCPPYNAGNKAKVIEGALRMSVDKLGKFTGDRDNRYGYGMPEADRLVKVMKGIA
jgi:subtilisin